MKIELHEILIKDIVNGYIDNQEEGVYGYGGRLNIRPKYQREFVYKDKQRDAVIETVRKNFPLNVMYWVKNGGRYEVLDGQQWTISICQYVNNDFELETALNWISGGKIENISNQIVTIDREINNIESSRECPFNYWINLYRLILMKKQKNSMMFLFLMRRKIKMIL